MTEQDKLTAEQAEAERIERSKMIDTIASRLFEQILEHTKEQGSDRVNEQSNVLGDQIADVLYDFKPSVRLIWYYAVCKVMVMLARVAQAETGIPPMATLCMMVKISGALMAAQDKDAARELGEGVTVQ